MAIATAFVESRPTSLVPYAAPPVWLPRFWRRLQQEKRAVFDGLEQPFVEREVNALIHYVSEQGLDKSCEILCPLYIAVSAYERMTPEERASADGVKKAQEILRHYSKLNSLPCLDGITGRTLIYSRSVSRHIRGLLAWGVLFALMAGGTEILLLDATVPQRLAEAMPAWIGMFVNMKVLSYLNPFFWGGVGACVFLIKSVSDKAKQLKFDTLRLQGVTSRIFLGAVFGALLVNGFGATSFEEPASGFSFGHTAIAFLAGLGVKALYGGFEALVEELDKRMSGRGASRSQPNAPAEGA